MNKYMISFMALKSLRSEIVGLELFNNPQTSDQNNLFKTEKRPGRKTRDMLNLRIQSFALKALDHHEMTTTTFIHQKYSFVNLQRNQLHDSQIKELRKSTV